MIELRAGDARVTIDPVRGGRLATLAVGGRDLLVGPPNAADRSFRWGCFLMAPWPGRLAHGRFEWQGRTIQLPRTHGRHAIHGLGWDQAWRVAGTSATEVALELDLGAAGWPLGGTMRERFVLAPTGLRLDAEIEASEATPAALGWHPWFLRREGASVRLVADAVLEVRGMIPTGHSVPPAGKFDLRDGPALGDRRLDDAYVGVRSPMTIAWPDLELRMSVGPEFGTAVVYTPRDVFCVEPLTSPPNALATGDAPVLAPGELLRSTVDLAWRRR